MFAGIVQLVDSGESVNEVEGAGNTPLHNAAYEGWKEGVELLLSLGAKVNASNNAGDRPWHWARNMGQTDVMDLLERVRYFQISNLTVSALGAQTFDILTMILHKVRFLVHLRMEPARRLGKYWCRITSLKSRCGPGWPVALPSAKKSYCTAKVPAHTRSTQLSL